MATAKPKRTPPLTWIRSHKIVSVLAIVVMLVIGVIAYEKITLYQNKRDFEQARIAIDKVYADVVREVGRPDDFKRTSSCSRRYQEFTGYGQPNCEVGSEFIYGVENIENADTILKKIQSILYQDKQFAGTGQSTSKISDTPVANTTYHTASDEYGLAGLKCTVNYIFDTPQETFLKLSEPGKKAFEITIGCYGSAKQVYYY